MKFKFDWFLKGMLVAVGLAFLWPAPGAHGGFLHPELLNKIGIALIFFLNGLGLSLLALRDGALRWQVHLLIQTSTFRHRPGNYESAAVAGAAAGAGADLAFQQLMRNR